MCASSKSFITANMPYGESMLLIMTTRCRWPQQNFTIIPGLPENILSSLVYSLSALNLYMLEIKQLWRFLPLEIFNIMLSAVILISGKFLLLSHAFYISIYTGGVCNLTMK